MRVGAPRVCMVRHGYAVRSGVGLVRAGVGVDWLRSPPDRSRPNRSQVNDHK